MPTEKQLFALRLAYSPWHTFSPPDPADYDPSSHEFDPDEINSMVENGWIVKSCNGEHYSITPDGSAALGLNPTPPERLGLEEALKFAIDELNEM
jgi:hypothetical protein